MAEVVYQGRSGTPIQVASEGKDTIFVGGAGVGDSRFKISDSLLGDQSEQHLFFWGVDFVGNATDPTDGDVIDLTDFFSEDQAIEAIAESDHIAEQVQGSGGYTYFKIDTDGDQLLDTQALYLHFVNTSVTAENLDEMILRAYS
jgi:hypothetical protein